MSEDEASNIKELQGPAGLASCPPSLPASQPRPRGSNTGSGAGGAGAELGAPAGSVRAAPRRGRELGCAGG